MSLSRYRSLLGIAGAARLLTSTVVARMPLGMLPLAVLLLTRERTGSLSAAGLAVGASTLAGAVVASVQAQLLHRFGIRRVVLTCATAQTLALAVLVAVARSGNAAAIVVLAGVAGAVVPPTAACARSLWPRIAPERAAQEAAYALDATSQEVIWTVGPLISAAAAAISPTVAILLIAAIDLLGNLWFASSPLCAGPIVTGVSSGRARPLASAPIRWLLGSVLITGFCVGCTEVGLPALAIHFGHTSAGGVLLALWSFGSMVGGVAVGAREWSTSLERRYLVLLVVLTVTTVPLALASSLGVVVALAFVAGVSQAPLFATQYLLLSVLAPPGASVGSFVLNTAALVSGISIGAAIAGAIVHPLGFASPFLVATGAAALATLTGAAMRSSRAPGHALTG